VILRARLYGTRNLPGMSLRMRLGLVAVVAAAVVGGFVPHTVLSATASSAAEVAQVAEVPFSGPVTCLDATCGKGSPAPAAPSPGAVLLAVVAGALAAAAAVTGVHRRRRRVVPLPAGVPDPLYHPPRFS
jgi:hypothetical protein